MKSGKMGALGYNFSECVVIVCYLALRVVLYLWISFWLKVEKSVLFRTLACLREKLTAELLKWIF